MRYISSHRQVVGLVSYLGLETQPFVVGQPKNIAYVRGKRLQTKDLGNAKIPYNLAPADVDGLANGITATAAERFLEIVLEKRKSISRRSIGERSPRQDFEGHKLNDLSMRYVFSRMVGHEAFDYAFDTSGYDSIFFTWNAADGFPWNLGDFGTVVTYSHLKNGYLAVALELQQRFEKAGGNIQLEHRLLSFDAVNLDHGTTGVQLKFACEGGRTTTVMARKLVLAMPRRSLELLEPSGAVMNASNTAVRELIESVTPIPLFKPALAYRTRWWERAGVTQGQTVTDLPIRQCYYWPIQDPKAKGGVILVYDDGQDLEYWASLRHSNTTPPSLPRRRQGGKKRRLAAVPTVGGVRGARVDGERSPSTVARDPRHRSEKRIRAVHRGIYGLGPQPVRRRRELSATPFDSYVVSDKILQPVADVPVFICGEAYSHQQGWVEGALATAENMLQRHLGLGPPPAPLCHQPNDRSAAWPPRRLISNVTLPGAW